MALHELRNVGAGRNDPPPAGAHIVQSVPDQLGCQALAFVLGKNLGMHQVQATVAGAIGEKAGQRTGAAQLVTVALGVVDHADVLRF